MISKFTSLFALTVSPFSGQWSPAELTGVQILLMAWWLFFMRVTAASGWELDQWLGEAALDALVLSHGSVKAAAADSGVNESQLRKALRGEAGHHLSLTWMVRWGLPFWCCFGPLLFAVVVRHHLAQIAEDLKLRKVS